MIPSNVHCTHVDCTLIDFSTANYDNMRMQWRQILQKNLSLKISLLSSFVLFVIFIIALPTLLQWSFFKEIHNNLSQLFAWVAVAFLVQFLVTTFIVQALASKPLAILKNTMKKIEEGQLHINMDVRSHDEMGEVFDSFNHMLARMQQMNDRKKNIEKRLIKTEESLKYKTELENKSKIIERMNKELTESFNNVALLYNVSQYLSAAIDVNELLQCVQHIFEEKFICKQYILAIAVDEEQLRLVHIKGFPNHSQWSDQTSEFGKGIMGRVAESQKTLHIEDLAKTPFGKNGLENELHGSLFCVPLTVRGKIMGVLLVARAATQSFSAADRQSLEAIAAQISNSYDRCVLYTKTKELSVRDELTNLYNRRYFQQVLDKEFKRAERYQRPMSVLMVDVDHFKQFNDTYGHIKGDITLKAIANVLFNSIREVDVIARYGGEEFVILLPNTELDNAATVAEKLRMKVQDELKMDIVPIVGKKQVPITISVGVAGYPIVQSLGELIHAADMALYQAKRQGRNRIAIAQTSEPELFAIPEIRKVASTQSHD